MQNAHLLCTALVFQCLAIVATIWHYDEISLINDMPMLGIVGACAAAAVSGGVLLLRTLFILANALAPATRRRALALTIAWLVALGAYCAAAALISHPRALIPWANRLTGPEHRDDAAILWGAPQQRWRDLVAGWLATAAGTFVFIEPVVVVVLAGLYRACAGRCARFEFKRRGAPSRRRPPPIDAVVQVAPPGSFTGAAPPGA